MVIEEHKQEQDLLFKDVSWHSLKATPTYFDKSEQNQEFYLNSSSQEIMILIINHTQQYHTFERISFYV